MAHHNLPKTKAEFLDIYEKVLLDSQDELYLEHGTEYREGWLDGAYLLYVALTEGARK